VFLDNTLSSHKESLHPGAQIVQVLGNAGGGGTLGLISIPSIYNHSVLYGSDAWVSFVWVINSGHIHFPSLSFLQELGVGTCHSVSA